MHMRARARVHTHTHVHIRDTYNDFKLSEIMPVTFTHNKSTSVCLGDFSRFHPASRFFVTRSLARSFRFSVGEPRYNTREWRALVLSPSVINHERRFRPREVSRWSWNFQLFCDEHEGRESWRPARVATYHAPCAFWNSIYLTSFRHIVSTLCNDVSLEADRFR